MMGLRYVLMSILILMLAACASAPVHYYTLLAPAYMHHTHAASPAFNFALLPVEIPAQVDQPRLVVRDGAQGVVVMPGQRWIAPLADEVRNALSVNLSRDLNAQDVHGLVPLALSTLRIQVHFRRFDSVPGQYVLIAANWVVHAPQHKIVLSCTSSVREQVGAGFDALVGGHQRALAVLATRIASVARALTADRVPDCPAN